jgi:aminobenzoyl-glutamate utilization protein B
MRREHRLRTLRLVGVTAVGLACGFAPAQSADEAAVSAGRQAVEASVASQAEEASQLALRIWELAEVGYQEVQSSSLLARRLEDAGFRLRRGVAGMPTAFVAEAGSGQPIVAILAEFDALPGLSQAAVPERQPRQAEAPGHGCGHHLFGTASATAGIAVAEWLASSGTPGTIRVYGTPAEEGGSGKVYLTLHWHPGAKNRVRMTTSLANKSAKFRFHGQSTHAAGAPERGRSALDGVEAMNYMVNLMREHVPQETRIHYVITRGGGAPNVVPDFAEVYYYVRHPDGDELSRIWDRVVTCAEAGALGTGTTMDYEVMHANRSLLPNETISRVLQEELTAVGGVEYDAEERAFAEAIRRTFVGASDSLGSERLVQPLVAESQMGSTDVGDVSWTVPTGGMEAATWAPGTPSHSWQAVACGGTTLGTKGMLVAARTLARAAVVLTLDADLRAAAWSEFQSRRGPDFVYRSLVGDRDPPLDYRR